MKHYIAVDLGATSVIMSLASVDGHKLIQIEKLCQFKTPLFEKEGKYFWDINDIFTNIIAGLKIAAEKNVTIESIGIDTWGVDFVSVGSDGSFVSMPRAYRDPYTDKSPEDFFSVMSREVLYGKTGIQIMNFNSVFQLYAQHKEDSVKFAKTDTFLFMPDALSYMLTGNKVCEYTILSTAAIMNPRTKTIDSDILSVCGTSAEKFAQIVFPGHIVGMLSDEICKTTGLSAVKVVAVAGHDTASAVAAIPAANRNFAYLSSGTWSLMGIETDEPIIDNQMQELNFTNEGGVGGTTRLLRNITGMWILEQCRSEWEKEGKCYSYDEIVSMAKNAPLSKDVMDPNDPCFAAPQNMPETIEKYCREHGMQVPRSDSEMIRLIFDSLTAKYADVLNKLRQIAPFEINTLHIIGGGSRNELLNQMTADACGIKVVAGPAECTTLGNIMIQAGLSRQDIFESVETKVYFPK